MIVEDQQSAVTLSTMEGEQTALVPSTSVREPTTLAMTVEDQQSAVALSTMEGDQTALVPFNSKDKDEATIVSLTVEDHQCPVIPSMKESKKTPLATTTSESIITKLDTPVEDQQSLVTSDSMEGEKENQQNLVTSSNGEVENKFWSAFANFIKHKQPPNSKQSEPSALVSSYLESKMLGLNSQIDSGILNDRAPVGSVDRDVESIKSFPLPSMPTMNKKTELIPSCSVRKLYVESFTFYKVLGEGSFGKVVLATHPATDQKLAVKFIKKRQLLRSGPQLALDERCILEVGRECPYITHIYGSFQTKVSLFIS